MIEDRVGSVQALCDQINTNDDRSRIGRNDPRCKWMFTRLSELTGSTHSELGQMLDEVAELPPTPKLFEVLVNIRDFLQYTESLCLQDEIEDILYAIGLSEEEVQNVIIARGLISENEPSGDVPKLSLHVRRKVLSCKGAWCPSAFAAVRPHSNLFANSPAGAKSELPKNVNSRAANTETSIPLELAIRLKRFLGIRHAQSSVPRAKAAGFDFAKAPPNATIPAPNRDILSESGEAFKEEPDWSNHARSDGHFVIPTPIESEGVRKIVQGVIEENDMRLGVISVELVLEKARQSGVQLSKERLFAMVSRLSGVVILEDNWLGRVALDSNGQRLLIELIAGKILSVVDHLPVDILHAQLGRCNYTYTRLSTLAVETYYSAHSAFRVDNGSVRAGRGVRYSPATELLPLEHNIWRAMQGSALPLSGDQISKRYIGRPKIKPATRDRVLNTSPLFTRHDGGYLPVDNSPELFNVIRTTTEFISPPSAHPYSDQPNDEPDARGSGSDIGNEDPATETKVSPLDTAPESDSEKPHIDTGRLRHFGVTNTETVSIRQILSEVSRGELMIPEIQRSYVWKQPQVRDLFDSLYNGYPVGTLLVWQTQERHQGRRVGTTTYHRPASGQTVKFLLDGQQRVTSLANAIEGTGRRLYFNAMDEFGSFRTSTADLAYSLRSIPIAGLDRESVESILTRAGMSKSHPEYEPVKHKLTRLVGIFDRVVPVETLHGFDYGEATDVFIRVNSRGTKLKNAELAIANLAYRLPGTVSGEIQKFSEKLASQGWDFPIPFVIRLLTAVSTQKVSYNALNAVSDDEIVRNWTSVQVAIECWLRQLRDQLGIHSEDVLTGKNSHIVPIAWLARHGNSECGNSLIYWFVMSNVFSRYSGATDTNLDYDLRGITSQDEPQLVKHILAPIKARRTSMRIEAADITRAGRQSALKMLMYLANIHIASSNLFGADGPSGTQQPPVPMSIFPSRLLRTVNFDPSDAWVKDGGLVNTIFVDPSFETEDVIGAARALRSEIRYQHGLPVLSVYKRNADIHEFFGQRSKLLLDQFNDVLTSLEVGQFRIREIERQNTSRGRGRQQLDHSNLPFDHVRRMMYDRIRRRILEIDSTVREIETGVYIGFLGNGGNRPFACIAKRKTVLTFTVDCEIEEITDPRGMCRDVTSVGKHGIGNTSFSISWLDEVPNALRILEQIMDLRA